MAIYFIYNPLNKLVRIGHSKQVKQLLSSLKTNSGIEMELLGVILGDAAKEKELHQRYQEKHVRGEWYRLTDEIEGDIISDAVDISTLEASPWSTVRVPQLLYDKLVELRERTGIPVSTAAKLAIERYLKTEQIKAHWLASPEFLEMSDDTISD